MSREPLADDEGGVRVGGTRLKPRPTGEELIRLRKQRVEQERPKRFASGQELLSTYALLGWGDPPGNLTSGRAFASGNKGPSHLLAGEAGEDVGVRG